MNTSVQLSGRSEILRGLHDVAFYPFLIYVRNFHGSVGTECLQCGPSYYKFSFFGKYFKANWER